MFWDTLRLSDEVNVAENILQWNTKAVHVKEKVMNTFSLLCYSLYTLNKKESLDLLYTLNKKESLDEFEYPLAITD